MTVSKIIHVMRQGNEKWNESQIVSVKYNNPKLVTPLPQISLQNEFLDDMTNQDMWTFQKC